MLLLQGRHSHRARSAKSAAKEKFARAASAATDFSSAARAIPIAISSRIWPKWAAIKAMPRPPRSIAIIAARKCSSSADASARSWRARATRIAKPRGVWCRAPSRRTSRTWCSMKNARHAPRANWCAATARFGEDSSACQNYPKCKYTRPITLGIKCPKKCNEEGEFVRRGSAKGRGRARIFYALQPLPGLRFHHAVRAHQ